MADKTIAFTLKVNGVDQAVSSIDELDSSIQQLEETLKSAKFGTEEFKAVEQQLIKARSAKEDLDKSLEGRGAEKRLQGIVGLAEGLGGAFAVASQASALFGKENADIAKLYLCLMCGSISLIVFGIIVPSSCSEIQCSQYKRNSNKNKCFT